MTFYVHDDLNDLALERIKATITTSKLDERNRYCLTRGNGAIIDRLVAVKRVAVQIQCDLRPSEVVEVFNNDRRTCDGDLRFDWWLA